MVAKRDLKIVQNILRSGRQEKKDEKYVFPSSFSPSASFSFSFFYLRINSINFCLFFFTVSSFQWKLFSITTKQNNFSFLKIPKEFFVGFEKLKTFFVTNNIMNSTVGLLIFEEINSSLRTLEYDT